MNYKPILAISIIGVLTISLFIFYQPPEAFKEEDCFSFYRFGDQFFVDLIPEKIRYEDGKTAGFDYQLTNPTNIPLSSLSIRAQVLYNGNYSIRPEGEDLIDEFNVKDGFSLQPGDFVEGSFKWKIPRGITSGTYVVNLYLISYNKFNMAGLSFLSNVPGISTTFEVDSKDGGMLRFDRTQVFVNDQKFNLRAFAPTFEKGQRISVKPVLLNKYPSNITSAISYKLYSFDDLNPEDELKKNSVSTQLNLTSNSENVLSYSMENLPIDAYLLKITAQDNNQKSILKMRIPVIGNKGRFVFAGFDRFPIEQGALKVYFCLTNSAVAPNSEASFNGKVTARVLDSSLSEIYSTQKELNISSSVDGYSFSFKSPKMIPKAKIAMTITDEDGKEHDSIVLDYDYANFVSTVKTLDVVPTSTTLRPGTTLQFLTGLHDDLSNDVEARVFYYVTDAASRVVFLSQEKTISRPTTLSIDQVKSLPEGNYKLTVVEKNYGISKSTEFSIS